MISIIIPVYNEEARINNIIKILTFLKESSEKYEVIVVDDGSTDATGKILLGMKKRYPLKILAHKKNMGKGAAVRTGIDSAGGNLIFFTDIDLSVSVDFIGNFLKRLTKNADVLIGTRVGNGAKIEKRQFFLRELSGEAFTLLANFLLGVGISDFTCGFKLFRRKAAERIFSRQLIKRWAFDAESLFLAKKYNFCIKEIPVQWCHVEGSKVRFPKDLIVTLISLFQIRFNDFKGKYE